MLDTDRFPEIRFESSRIEQVEGNRHKIVGELTIKEVPVVVELDAKFQGTGPDAEGVEKTLFRVEGADRVGPDARRDHRRHHGDPPVTRILAISGSLRERSYNRALLRAARELAPPGIEIEEFDLSPIPFYDGDVEAAGDPASVVALKAAVRRGGWRS